MVTEPHEFFWLCPCVVCQEPYGQVDRHIKDDYEDNSAYSAPSDEDK